MNEAGLALTLRKPYRVDVILAGKSFEFLGYRFKRSSKGSRQRS